MGRKKSRIVHTNSETYIDPATGEILGMRLQERASYKESEPDYVKLYYARLLANHKLFSDSRMVQFLVALSAYVPYADTARDGYVTVFLTGYAKQQIAAEMDCSLRTVDRVLKELIDGDIIRKIASQTYAVSPMVLAKGGWDVIKVLQEQWVAKKVTADTMQFNTELVVSSEAPDAITTPQTDDQQMTIFDYSGD